MKLLLKVAITFSTVLFIIFELFPLQIIKLFGEGSDLYFQFAIKYMRIFLMFIFINGVQITTATFFPSIGKPFKGALISLTKQLIILFPLLIFLPIIFGVDGIIYATPLTDLISFIVAIIFLKHEFNLMPRE